MIAEMYIEWKELWRNEWYLENTPEYFWLLNILTHLDRHFLPTGHPVVPKQQRPTL